MIETNSLRDSQEADRRRSELEKQALQRQTADRFEAYVKGIAVAKATQDMRPDATEARRNQ